MMYRGILAFAVLSASSLVKSAVGDFQCPVCNARGPNARAECDKKITYKNCTQENPICVSTLYTFGRFLRDCSDESNYETNLENCKRSKTCRKAKCKEPKCKAEIPLVGDFQCPVCNARGPNARVECDEKITYKNCTQENPICVSTLYTFGRFLRDCSDESNYETNLENCKRSKTCRKAKCKEPKCKAEIPLECPFCRAEGENAAADCDKNITYMECEKANSTCAVVKYESTFRRTCLPKEKLDSFVESCRVRTAQGVNCTTSLAGCDKPRCKAEFPVCPYCDSTKSLKHCDMNIKTRTCQQWETRCFVRKQTYGATDYFMRGCIDPKTAEDIALGCTKGDLKGVCQFGTCQGLGCLASFETKLDVTARGTLSVAKYEGMWNKQIFDDQ